MPLNLVVLACWCRPLVMKHGGRCGKLRQHPTIFMRWKEQCFVNTNEQCGLTIAGGRSSLLLQHGARREGRPGSAPPPSPLCEMAEAFVQDTILRVAVLVTACAHVRVVLGNSMVQ